MSYIVLHADRMTTALADDPVIPAADLPTLHGALALFGEADRIRGEAERHAAAGRDAGHAEGYAAGHAEGVAAAAAEARAELFRLAMRDGEDRRRRQGEVAALALEVVRRIAGDIGDAALVAGLADRAAASLAPDVAATVRVAPAQADAVATRLVSQPGVVVEADPSVDATDCIVETALGRTHAGLDTQLAQIEAAWRDAGR